MVTKGLDVEQIKKRIGLVGERIGLVDKGIVALLTERQKLVLIVEELKRIIHVPIYRKEIEDDRLQAVRALAVRYGLNPDFVQSLFYQMIGESNKVQMIQLQKSAGFDSGDESEEAWNKRLKENLLSFTAKCAPFYDERYGQAFFATKVHAEFEAAQVAELAKTNGDGLALDLGCATGRHTFLLAPHFKKVVGYDISPDMISVAQKNAGLKGVSNADFVVHDLEKGIPQEARSVALVVMTTGSASDIPGFPNLLREIRRVLKPGGKVFLSFYNRDALVYQWGFMPWPVGLAAEVNIDRHCLNIVWEEDGVEHTYSVYAYPCSPGEIEKLLPAGLAPLTLMTHPTMASITPNLLFEKQGVRDSVMQIDKRLAEEGGEGGAYLTVVARRT